MGSTPSEFMTQPKVTHKTFVLAKAILEENKFQTRHMYKNVTMYNYKCMMKTNEMAKFELKFRLVH